MPLPDGGLSLVDRHGHTVATIPPGMMSDAAGLTDAVSNGGVAYTFRPSGVSAVDVTVHLDETWLSALGRAYPVTVDPTTTTAVGGDSDDTYVTNGHTANNSGSSVLMVGSPDGGSDTSIAFLHFGGVTSGANRIPAGSTVLGATLAMYETYSGSCTAESLNAYMVLQPWSGSSMTNYPGASATTTNGASAASSAGANCPSGDQWVQWNVTGIVSEWVGGQYANDGLEITEPGVNLQTAAAFREFASANVGGTTLSVTWTADGASYSPSPSFLVSPTGTSEGTLPITVTNTGAATWPVNSGYSIGYHLNGPEAATYVSYPIPTTTSPGQSVIINFPIGPYSPGSYNLYWDMSYLSPSTGVITYFSAENVGEIETTVVIPATGPQITSVNPSPESILSGNYVTLFAAFEDVDYSNPSISAYFRICSGSDAESGTCYSSGWVAANGLTALSWSAPALTWNSTWYWHVYLTDGVTQTNPVWVAPLYIQLPLPAGDELGSDPFSPAQGLVNPVNRNLTFDSTDANVSNAGLPLRIVRSYNSANANAGAFGQGFTSILDYSVDIINNDCAKTTTGEICPSPNPSATVSVNGPDGAVNSWGQNPDGSWVGTAGSTSQLLGSPSSGWTLQTGSATYQFNRWGQITSQTIPGGSSLTFGYAGPPTIPMWEYRSTVPGSGYTWASTTAPPSYFVPQSALVGTTDAPLAGVLATNLAGSVPIYRCASPSNYEYLSGTLACPYQGTPYLGANVIAGDGYAYSTQQPGTSPLYACVSPETSFQPEVNYYFNPCSQNTSYDGDSETVSFLGYVYPAATEDGTATTITASPSGRTLHITWSNGVVSQIATDPVTEGSTTAPLVWTYAYNTTQDYNYMSELIEACGPLVPANCTTYTWTGYGPGTLLGDAITSVTDPDGNIQAFSYAGASTEPAAVTAVTDANGNTTNYKQFSLLRRYYNNFTGLHGSVTQQAQSYSGSMESVQGGLAQDEETGTEPLYMCSVVWPGADAPNDYVNADGTCDIPAGVTPTSWTVEYPPAGYSYTTQQPNTIQIFECQNGPYDHFISTSTSCEGTQVISSLGWIESASSVLPPGPSPAAATVTITTEPPDPYTSNTRYSRSAIFDGSGRLIQTVDENSGTRTYGYNSDGFLDEVIDQNGNAVTMTTDSLGHILSKTTTSTPGDTSTDYFTYASGYPIGDPRNGELLTESDGVASGPSDVQHETSFTYDAEGNRLTQTSPVTAACPSGCVTRWTYTNGSTTNSSGQVMPAGLPATQTKPGQNPTTWTYYPTGDLYTMIDAEGLGVSNAFDQLGRLTATITWTTEAVQYTAYTYDNQGNVLTQTDPPTTNSVTGVQHEEVITNTYDADSQLIKQVQSDAKGGDPSRTTTYTYDHNGNKTSTTDPAGRKTTLLYDYNNNLETSTDPAGTITSYTYWPTGLSESQTLDNFVDSPQKPGTPRNVTLDSRSYDPAGRLTYETDAAGYTTAYTYYDDDRIATKTLTNDSTASGSKVSITEHSYTYDAAGDVTSDITGNGLRQTVNSYDAGGELLTSITDPSGKANTTAYTYNQDGQPVTVALSDTNGAATTTAYAYNAAAEIVTRTDASGSLNLKTAFTYDNAGRVLTTTDPDGGVTTDNYDQNGNLISQAAPAIAVSTNGGTPSNVAPTTYFGYDTYGDPVSMKDPNGNVTTDSYNLDGQLTSALLPSYTTAATSPLGPAGTVVAPIEKWTYNSIGAPASYTDGEGNTTTYVTDKRGRITQSTSASNPSAPADVTAYYYSDDNEPFIQVNGDGIQTWTGYDAEGQLTARAIYTPATASWSTTDYVYDPAGDQTSITDPMGNVSTFTYDGLGEQITATQPAATGDTTNRTTGFTYNALGEPLTVTDPLGRETLNAYDPAGRQTSTQPYYHAAAVTPPTTVTYDNSGNPIKVVDPNSWATTIAYNADNQPTAITRQVNSTSNVTVSATYDPDGNTTSVTNGDGNVTVTEYDSQNLPTTVIEPTTSALPNPAQHTWNTVYDQERQPLVNVGPGGNTSTNTYDPRGYLASQTIGGPGPTINNTYGYDTTGQLTSFSTPNGTQTLTYNGLGEPVTSTGPEGSLIASYDLDGQPTTVTDAAGTNTYTWSPQGNLSTAAVGLSGLTTTYKYDADNELTGATYPNGSAQGWGYDNLGRVTTQGTYSSATNALDWLSNYSYDNDSNLTASSTGVVINGATTSINNSYTYDGLDRLTSWKNTAGVTTTYGWDGASNRSSAGNTTFSYNADNQLTSSTSGSATTNYSYNSQGDLTSTSSPTSNTSYTYNNADQVTNTTSSGGTATYTYDSLGRLASINANQLSYDAAGTSPVAIGTTLISRTPDGTPVAQSAGGAVTLPLVGSPHGDVIGQLNPSGSAITGYDAYDPFGSTNQTVGNPTSALGYQGDTTLPDGTVNMSARNYNPTTATFQTQDSLLEPPNADTGFNGYSYADGNPLTNTDPTGHLVEGGGGGGASDPAMLDMLETLLGPENGANFYYTTEDFLSAQGSDIADALSQGSAAAFDITDATFTDLAADFGAGGIDAIEIAGLDAGLTASDVAAVAIPIIGDVIGTVALFVAASQLKKAEAAVEQLILEDFVVEDTLLALQNLYNQSYGQPQAPAPAPTPGSSTGTTSPPPPPPNPDGSPEPTTAPIPTTAPRPGVPAPAPQSPSIPVRVLNGNSPQVVVAIPDITIANIDPAPAVPGPVNLNNPNVGTGSPPCGQQNLPLNEQCSPTPETEPQTATNGAGAGQRGPPSCTSKRGPKPYPTGAHNQAIAERIQELITQGYVHLNGGNLTEEFIRTPNGIKSARRPDITMLAPDGTLYRENVGLTNSLGNPVPREVDALNDIEGQTGQRPVFTPYVPGYGC